MNNNPIEIIQGKCPSKSNSYRVKFGGKGVYKTDKVKAYERAFALQCRHYRNRNISVPFELELTVFFANKAADLVGSFKVILDCLQQVNAVSNDKLCYRIVAKKEIDHKQPRIEFSINTIEI